MWTSQEPARYDRTIAYPSDLTDDEWGLVEPLIPRQDWRWQAHGDHAEVVNGLMYILSTGCQWRAIPKDLRREAGLRLLRSVDL